MTRPHDGQPRRRRPWVLVLTCPECGSDVPWNDRSTARRCPNLDCRALVRKVQVREQIQEHLEHK